MAIMKRMLPPLHVSAGGITSQPVNGRIYQGVASSTVLDVPDFDAELLAQQALGPGNNWSLTSWCPCGPTADRPTDAAHGFYGMFLDTSLGFIIAWNAARSYWINPATGAQV